MGVNCIIIHKEKSGSFFNKKQKIKLDIERPFVV